MIARRRPRDYRPSQPRGLQPLRSLRDALEDRNLLGRALRGDSWRAWRVLLIAAMGEALTDEERVIFKQLTQRDQEPGIRVSELALVIGRRGGKSRAVAVLANYIAALCKHILAPREKGIVLVVAQNQEVAKGVLDYAQGCFERSPVLRQEFDRRINDSIHLKNGIILRVRPASFRGLRGPTYVAAICDEIAFWWQDAEANANPDVEIITAIRPSLKTSGGPLIMASSPYARKGELWKRYRSHYGPDGKPSILVAQATTRVMNPNFPQEEIDEALQEDPVRNRAEYLAEFRSDSIEAFITREVVEACVANELYERKPLPGRDYVGFVDPSGGVRDSFTMAIAHAVGDVYFLDCVDEVRPNPVLSPERCCEQFAATFKRYGITKIQGDHYAGAWPVEQFAKHGITYEQSARRKSDIYLDTLPLFNSGRIDLLDNERLVKQLCDLERSTARGGRDSVDHPPRLHDDVANAVCGALLLAAQRIKRAHVFAGERELDIETNLPLTTASLPMVTEDGRVVLRCAPGSNSCITRESSKLKRAYGTRGGF